MNMTNEQHDKILSDTVYTAAKIWCGLTEAAIEDSVRAAVQSIKDVEIDSSTDMLDLAFKSTEAVHAAWANSNLYKLASKVNDGLLYQFLPSEFIGFDEFAKDILFVRPVFKVLFDFNFEVEDLRAKYADSVASYQNYHNVDFSDRDDLAQWLRGPIMKMQVAPEVYEYLIAPGNAFNVAREVQDLYEEND